MTTHAFVRRAALAAVAVVALGACWPDVQEESTVKVDSSAVGGTPNRDNTQAGANRDIAPPGQGSALSDTAAGRLPTAGVSGPTQALSGAAPPPQNANAQTRAQGADSTAASRATPRAGAQPAPKAP